METSYFLFEAKPTFWEKQVIPCKFCYFVVYNLGVSKHFVLKNSTQKMDGIYVFIIYLLLKSDKITIKHISFIDISSRIFNDKL